MPPKRTYNKKTRKIYKKYGAKRSVLPAVRTLQAVARRAVARTLAKNVEVKQSVYTASDGTEISHNNFITLTNNLLQTTQGVTDPRTVNTANRIGDKITIKNVKFAMMVELNERYADVTFRVLVVRTARGMTPDRATLFNGLSGNKMIDTLNTERYGILYQKWFKIVAPNHGDLYANGAGGIPQPSGFADNQTSTTFSRATRIVKFSIPGSKFSKNGVITYEDGTATPKYFDYHVLLYAYSNYTTLQDSWNVGRLNDFVTIINFTDL